MRILTVIPTWPPYTYGGGEVSALNLCHWLRDRGHELATLTTAPTPAEEVRNQLVDGVRLWRMYLHRSYTFWNHTKASKWQKLVWHSKDHLSVENRKVMSVVLDKVKPDLVLLHVISGIGYNALYEVAKRDVPAIYFMHDLNLVCLRGGIFKHGRECRSQCWSCRASSRVRQGALLSIRRLKVVSPSKANLDLGTKFFRQLGTLGEVALNANIYPQPQERKSLSSVIRFLYVGRIEPTKGVSVLLEVLDELSRDFQFTLTIAGTGGQESELRAAYGSRSWCSFLGFVPLQRVSNLMVTHDALCVPSVWPENSPGTVIHALSQGLPVIASNKGGIPELVRDGRNGRLVAAGNHTAWVAAIREILSRPADLARYSRAALEEAGRFDQNAAGVRLEGIMMALVKRA
jgi:glycosyltransferase involved in cell wall biosynthesis